MEIINNRLDVILSYTDNQLYYKNKKYKWFEYLFFFKPNEKDTIIYNLFTREIIIFDEEDFDEEKEKYKEFLVEHWFLIPEDMDDKTMVDTSLSIIKNINSYKEQRPRMFVILPTTGCNATCSYCFEKNWNHISMTEDIALQVIEFIKSNKGSGKIGIKWFGGEPLTNSKIMTFISNKLLEENIEYDSNILSNGYLWDQFDENTIKNIWKITKTQFTIDAVGDKYDKIKGIKGAFETTMSNIEYLLSIGVSSCIRLIATSKNTEDLLEVIKYAKNRFDNYDNFYIYVSSLYEEWDNIDNNDGMDMFEIMKYISDEISRNGYYLRFQNSDIKNCHCMADSNFETVVILPNGQLQICEHCNISDDNYGSIYTNIDKNKYNPYFEKQKEVPECKKCFYYPQCFMLEKCATDRICCKGNREYHKYLTEMLIKNKYNNYLKKRNP